MPNSVLSFFCAVDHPRGVENLVAAVFGIGLGEHHQFDVGRVAAGLGEDVEQVIDFVVGQGQTERAIGVDQRGFTASQHVDRSQRLRREMAEQFAGFGKTGEHRFGHPVVQQAGNGFPLIGAQRAVVLGHNMEGDDALDAFNRIQIAVPGNVGGLRRPRRNGADARGDEEQFAGITACRLLFQQCRQLGPLFSGQRPFQCRNVPVIRRHGFNIGNRGRQTLNQALQAEGGKGGIALEAKDVGHGFGVSDGAAKRPRL
jgi:hypothetical protein